MIYKGDTDFSKSLTDNMIEIIKETANVVIIKNPLKSKGEKISKLIRSYANEENKIKTNMNLIILFFIFESNIRHIANNKSDINTKLAPPFHLISWTIAITIIIETILVISHISFSSHFMGIYIISNAVFIKSFEKSYHLSESVNL